MLALASPVGTNKPTTVTTIGQAYHASSGHYYAAATLGDRVLLAAAFTGLTQQLDRLGQDQPTADLPALLRQPTWLPGAGDHCLVPSGLSY